MNATDETLCTTPVRLPQRIGVSPAAWGLWNRSYNPEVGRFVSMDPYQGSRNNPLTLHKYVYAHADPINNRDPSGLFSIGSTLSTIGIGFGVLAGITAGSYLGVVPIPASRPGFWEGLIPFWGSGKAFLYDLHHGNYLSAAVNSVFFATDFLFLRSLAAGVAQVGWKQVFSPGIAKLTLGEWLDGSFHAAWQIGDKFFHALGNTGGQNWVVRVFTRPLKVIGEEFPTFIQKFGFPFPVASRGLAQICTREADCITAMLAAIHRAEFGALERVFKAAVIEAFGQDAIPK
jgi:hypothetical protein